MGRRASIAHRSQMFHRSFLPFFNAMVSRQIPFLHCHFQLVAIVKILCTEAAPLRFLEPAPFLSAVALLDLITHGSLSLYWYFTGMNTRTIYGAHYLLYNYDSDNGSDNGQAASHIDRVQGRDGRKGTEPEHRTGHVKEEAATIPIYKYIIWSPVLWPQDVSDPCTVFF